MGIFALRYRLISDLSRDDCLARLSGFADDQSIGGLIDFFLTGNQRTQFFVRIRRYRFRLRPKEDPFPFGSTFIAGKLKHHPMGTLVKIKFCYHRLTILLSLMAMFALIAAIFWRLQTIGWTTGLSAPIDGGLIIAAGLAAVVVLWWLYFFWERRKIARQFLEFLRQILNARQ